LMGTAFLPSVTADAIMVFWKIDRICAARGLHGVGKADYSLPSADPLSTIRLPKSQAH